MDGTRVTNEYLLEMWERYRRRGLSRRNFVRLLTALGGTTLVIQFLAACGGDDDDTAPATSTSSSGGGATSTAAPTSSGGTPGTGAGSATQTASSGSTGGTPKAGGDVTITFYQETETLNYYYTATTRDYYEMALEGLIGASPESEYTPLLVEEVPTIQNGLVSEDGLEITYRLRSGMLWDDGEPITAEDIKFTWEALTFPENTVGSKAGYDQIESIEVTDDVTAIMTFSKVYPAYPVLFPQLLPKHAFESTLMNDADYNRAAVSSGAFRFVEWVPGDHMTWERNTNFREEGKPYLDKIFERFVPSREVAIQQIKTGETDVVWDLIEAQIPEFEKLDGIDLWLAPSPYVERMLLNLSNPKGDNPGDPDDPHPILGELEFRQAFQLAIDKQLIVDTLLFGKTSVAVATIGIGWALPDDLKPSEYNPEKAIELLDGLGWKPGSDGIRERDGIRCSLEFVTTAGNQLRERQQQLIQEMVKEVGIELKINNVPGSVLFGSWSNGAASYHGTFDILMYTQLADIDPQVRLFRTLHSSQIPTAENSGNGNNFYRLVDSEVDAALETAGSTVDQEKRKEAYSKLFHRVDELIPEIYLYRRAKIHAFRSNVKGWVPNPWMAVTWDAKNWYRE